MSLGHWFERAGYSKHGLARDVTRHAAEVYGYTWITPDASRVCRWLAGEVPRLETRGVVCELLSLRTGELVTPEMCGWPTDNALDMCFEEGHTVEEIHRFARTDLMLTRRALMSWSAVTGVALTEPLRAWTATPRASETALTPGRIGLAEVQALEQAALQFRLADRRFGGGMRREAVVGQLKSVVEDMRGHTYRGELGRRLWGVVADLARLAGWMSHDVGLEGAAQRYYALAINAARQAGDALLGAEVLSRMARQALHLGRPDEGLRLIRLAQEGSTDTMPRLRAMIFTAEAWAHAAQGRAVEARGALGISEDLLAEAPPRETDPPWIRYFDEADHQGMSYLVYGTLTGFDPRHAATAVRHAERTLAMRHAQGRTHVLDLIGLAGARFAAGHPDGAAEVSDTLFAEAAEIRSTRTRDRLRTVVAQSRRYDTAPARRFRERALALT